MLTRQRKTELVKDLSSSFEKSKASFLVDYKGMNVEQVTDLRKKLFAVGAELKVVRNTLAKIALKDHPESADVLSDKMVGTNAFVFAFEEASGPAKTLAEVSKTVEALKIKSGVMSGKELNEDQVKYLATLPGKDELRAKLLGTFSAPASQFVRVLAAAPQGFVTVLKAKCDKG